METEYNNSVINQLLFLEKSDACATAEDEYPPGTTRLDCQVGGHISDSAKNKIGMLRGSNGRVLKSCKKSLLQEREIAFYEAIENSSDPIYKELLLFAPKYYGTWETIYRSKPIKFLVLKDITEGMKKPCVMDVKIGKQTWDPLADPAKRESDERKYASSKKAYGFCIPGFQVYDPVTGRLQKFNKDYTKKLDANGVVDALRIFLNTEPGKLPNRELIVNLLSHLWKILAFFRTQRKFRFYSSSLLIVYDAHQLRNNIRAGTKENIMRGINTRGKTFSSCDAGLSGNGSTLEAINPKYLAPLINAGVPTVTVNAKSNHVRAIDRLKNNRLKRSVSLSNCELANVSPNLHSSPIIESTIERSGSFGRGLDDSFSPLCRTHSFTNNYDRDIAEMKEDYTILLEKLTGKSKLRQNWVRVNMIDFTHVFEAENNSTDTNYLEGIDHLIKILESFL